MQAMLLGVPQVLAYHVDALAAVCGHGHQERVRGPIRVWDSMDAKARHLLIAGTYYGEQTFEALTLDRLQQPPYGLRQIRGVSTQVHAAITTEQADWIAGKVRDLGITSLALFSSQYHLLRPFLTLLRALERLGIAIPVVPVAVVTASSAPVPEVPMASAYELCIGEAIRIVTYQRKGDVASFEAFQQAMRILDAWPPLLSHRDDL